MVVNFSCLFVLLSTDFFSSLLFIKKLFQEHHQCVKHFGSRSGPVSCLSDRGHKLFAKLSADDIEIQMFYFLMWTFYKDT